VAKGIDNHFADNWQKAGDSKDSYASRIRQQGEIARTTTQAIDKAKMNSVDSAKVNDPAKALTEKPAQDVKDLPQAMQNARLETQGQAQAVKSRELAEQNYQNVRRDAHNLKNLEKNTKQPTGAETVTKDAVAQRPQANSADLGRNTSQFLQPNLLQQAGKPVSRDEAREKPAAQRPQTKGAEKAAPEGDAEKAAQPKPLQPEGKAQPIAAAAVADGARAAAAEHKEAASDFGRTGDADEEKATEGEEGKGSTGYTSKAGNREKSRELGALLGGFTGSSSSDTDKGSSEGSEAVAKVAAETKPEPLPESDPNFKVYSEFDSEVAGPHTVKAKAQVFSNMVEKKLRQIAKFDEDLGSKLKPITERLVGESKDLIKITSFLDSPYGGAIG